MELRKTHSVRIFYYKGISIGKINARFNYSSTHEYIYLTANQHLPYILKVILVHLTVRVSNAGVWNSSHYPVCNEGNILYLVIKIKNLSASQKLLLHCVKENAVVVLENVGLHGSALARSLIEYRHIAYAVHCHIKRSGNGRCAQSENVNVLRHFLKLLLLSNAEALLLVDYKQSEVTEFYVL